MGESYDRTKGEAETMRATDPGTLFYRHWFGRRGLGVHKSIAIGEKDMMRLFGDFRKNIKAAQAITLPRSYVHVRGHTEMPSYADECGKLEHNAGQNGLLEEVGGVQALWHKHENSVEPEFYNKKPKDKPVPGHHHHPHVGARVLYENLNGTYRVKLRTDDGFIEWDAEVKDMYPLRHMQIRLPLEIVQAMVDMPTDHLQTNTLFYMLNKFNPDGSPRIVLLDQTALVCAMRCVAPTLNISCAYGIALNVLVRYGVNGDINGDGVISPEEWAALDEILRSQEEILAKKGVQRRNGQKSRLVALML